MPPHYRTAAFVAAGLLSAALFVGGAVLASTVGPGAATPTSAFAALLLGAAGMAGTLIAFAVSARGGQDRRRRRN